LSQRCDYNMMDILYVTVTSHSSMAGVRINRKQTYRCVLGFSLAQCFGWVLADFNLDWRRRVSQLPARML